MSGSTVGRAEWSGSASDEETRSQAPAIQQERDRTGTCRWITSFLRRTGARIIRGGDQGSTASRPHAVSSEGPLARAALPSSQLPKS